MATFREFNHGESTICVYDVSTPDIVVSWLERCIKDHRNGRNRRVRIFLGDTERGDFERVHGREPIPGKDWGEEYFVSGYIGRSTGIKPIPLMIHSNASHGGPGISDGCIVRMFVDGKEVYRHPNYHSIYDTAKIVPSDMAEYKSMVVSQEGEVQARFRSELSATRWLAFMRGERMAK